MKNGPSTRCVSYKRERKTNVGGKYISKKATGPKMLTEKMCIVPSSVYQISAPLIHLYGV